VGYKKSEIYDISTQQQVNAYICFYANIGILDDTSNIKNSAGLNGFIDTYIEREFDMDMYEIIGCKHQMVKVEIQQDKAEENYKIVKKKLVANMQEEMNRP
jgi:hypothetical protein